MIVPCKLAHARASPSVWNWYTLGLGIDPLGGGPGHRYLLQELLVDADLLPVPQFPRQLFRQSGPRLLSQSRPNPSFDLLQWLPPKFFDASFIIPFDLIVADDSPLSDLPQVGLEQEAIPRLLQQSLKPCLL